MLNKDLDAPGPPNDLHVTATFLFHAVQILFFAPREHTLDQDPVLMSKPTPEKRYPMPDDPSRMMIARNQQFEQEGPIRGSQLTLYGDRFTLDDIYRVLLLFSVCIKRRRKGFDFLRDSQPNAPSIPHWRGYLNPDHPVRHRPQVADNALSAMASHLSSMSSQGHQAARAEFISAGEGNGSATALNGEHQKEPGFPYLEPEEAEQEEENLRGSVKSTFSSGLVGYGASESWALGVQTSGSSDAGHPMKTFSHKARVNSLPRLTDSALETFAEDTSRDWHNNTRPDDVSSRSRERETSFEDLIDKDELNEYMEQEISHPTTRAILESEAGKLDEHLQRFKKAFIMDRVTSDINTPSLYARSQEHRLNDNPRNDPEPALDMTTGQFAGKSTFQMTFANNILT